MHPEFTLIYPYHTNDRVAKVMTYARKYARTDKGRHATPIRTIPRLDLSAHPTILITDHYVDQDKIRIINFYNDVDNPSSLQSLLTLDLDFMFPTILIGDFNLHSRSWSPENIPQSPNANKFESWAADQTFSLQTAPGSITRRVLRFPLWTPWHVMRKSLTTMKRPRYGQLRWNMLQK